MLDFPTSPVEGQSHFDEGQLWTFTDGAWIVGALTSELTELYEGEFPTVSDGYYVVGKMLVQWGLVQTDGNGYLNVPFPQPYKNGTTPHVTTNTFADVDTATVRRSNNPIPSERYLSFDVMTFNTAGSTRASVFVGWMSIGEAPDDLAKTEHALGGNGELAPQVMVENDTDQGWVVIGDVLYCWGAFSTDGTGTAPVTYPQAFESSPAVSCSGINAVGTSRIFTIDAPSPTGFTGVCQDTAAQGASRSAYWTAFGPAPDALKKPKSLIGGTGQIAIQEVSGGDTAAGYYVVGDLLIQWGNVTTNAARFATITWPTPFKTGTVPQVSGTPQSTDGNESAVFGAPTTASCDLYTSAINRLVRWHAIGEAPDHMKKDKDVLGGTVADVARVSKSESDYLIVGKKMICWGVTAGVGTRTVTFPKAFSAGSVPRVTMGHDNTAEQGGTTLFSHSMYAITNVSFDCKGQFATNVAVGESGVNLSWIAIGEAPQEDQLPEHVVGKGISEYHDPTGVASWRIVGETLEVWGELVSANGNSNVAFPKEFAYPPQVTLTALYTSGTTPVAALDRVREQDVRFFVVDNLTDAYITGVSTHYKATGKWDGIS